MGGFFATLDAELSILSGDLGIWWQWWTIWSGWEKRYTKPVYSWGGPYNRKIQLIRFDAYTFKYDNYYLGKK